MRPLQRGAALLIFLVLLLMGGLTYVVNNLGPETLATRRAQTTSDALKQAREALLGYALRFREEQLKDGQSGMMYGYLPLPDLGTSRNNNVGCTQEGCDAAYFSGNAANLTVIGRLPWRALGIAPLRDSNGECLWYAVSGSHQRIQRSAPMNWDTLGQLDIVVANSSSTLASTLASAHDRPVAVIFSPGPPLPGQNRSASGGDSVSECGGNYNAANYLDPGTTALDGTTNYFAGSTNAATGDTGTSTKSLTATGEIHRKSDGTLWANACPSGSTCTLATNDRSLTLGSETLFGAIRKSPQFRADINSMLDRMVSCLRDQLVATTALPITTIDGFTPAGDKSAGRIASSSCYGDEQNPLGYFSHYQDQIFLAKANAGNLNVTADSATQSCPGVLLFAGQRATNQARSTTAEKNTPSNYLEGSNRASFTAAGSDFSGDSQLLRVSSTQTLSQDIVRCIPATASFTVVAPSVAAAAGSIQLANYAAATRTLTLGSAGTSTNYGATTTSLYACAWTPETHAAGSGFRSYFRFRIRQVGEGFTFAVIDGDRNGADVCGAARQHLGYSGNNGATPYIQPPKLAFEFDTFRNGNFSEPASLSNGRYDPCYQTSCGATQNLSSNAHAAVVYWGYESAHNTTPVVTQIQEDDNVHGFPWPPDSSARPAPLSHYPYSTGNTTNSSLTKDTIYLASLSGYEDKYINAKVEVVIGANRERRTITAYDKTTGQATVSSPFSTNISASVPYTIYWPGVASIDSMGASSPLATASAKREYHARVEVTRSFTSPSDAKDGTTGIQVKLWVTQHNATNISAMTYSAGTPPTVTVTAAGHGFNTGDSVEIKDAVPAGYNGTYTITRIDANQFSFNLPEGSADPGRYISSITWTDYSWTTDLVTVTSPNHGLNTGNTVTITGAVPTAYNGTHVVTRVDANTYTYGLELGYEPGNMPPAIAAAVSLTPLATAIANTTRPMSELYPGQDPTIYDSVTIYDEQTGACAVGEPRCATGQSCGSDNMCYRPFFRNLRLGFTIGERATTSTTTARGQLIEIKDQATTWLP